MEITRRKFLKFLAVGLPAAAIAPAALIGEVGDGSGLIMYHDKIIIDQRRKPGRPSLSPSHPWRGGWVTLDELRADISVGLDKNPIFRGELGIYENIAIHERK